MYLNKHLHWDILLWKKDQSIGKFFSKWSKKIFLVVSHLFLQISFWNVLKIFCNKLYFRVGWLKIDSFVRKSSTSRKWKASPNVIVCRKIITDLKISRISQPYNFFPDVVTKTKVKETALYDHFGKYLKW